MRIVGNVLIYAGLGMALLVFAVWILDATGAGVMATSPATILLWLGVALLGWLVRVVSKWEKSLSRS